MVEVFHVPFGYRGFTRELFKKVLVDIKGDDYSGLLYLAPTPEKIKDAQRALHSLTKGFYIQPEMMTIKQLSRKLHSLYGPESLIPQTSIPIIISRLAGNSIGFSSILSSFISEMKQHRPLSGTDEISHELRAAFKELNIPEEGLKRTDSAMETYGKYQELLDKNHSIDENDLLRKCAWLMDRHKPAPRVLILDGFYEITPSEKLILKGLIEKSGDTYIATPHHGNFTTITGSFSDFIKNNFSVSETYLSSVGKPSRLDYISYPSVDEEVEGIARHIKNMHISGRNRALDKISVIFPNPDIYHDIIPRIFRRYGIPYSFPDPLPAGRTKPFLDLLAMLESIADDFPRLPFSRFLTSRHFRKLPEVFRDWVPKISLYSGVIRNRGSWTSLSNTLSTDMPELSNILEEIEKEFEWVFEKLSPLISLKDNGTLRQFSTCLQKVASEFDFHDDSIDVEEILSGATRELMLIDNLIPESASVIRQHIDSLRFILNATGTEAEGSGVQITGFFGLRSSEPEYLYFGGLKDGDLPSMPEMDHILPDSVRTRLGLVNMKKYLLLQKFLFSRLTESSGEMHLSYPSMEADKVFLPSPFLPWRAETSENIPGILCKEEHLAAQGKEPLTSAIKEISGIGGAKKHFGERAFIRVTDIDSYRTCARKFFIEKVLRTEPPEVMEYAIEATLLGKIIHKIMEKLISAQFSSLEEFRSKAEVLLKEELKGLTIDDYWKKFLTDSFLGILPDIYDMECELRDEGYSFMKAEIPVEGEVIKGIKLRGKIDRVDKENDSVQIIDYKTGSVQFSGTQVMESGATLQLFLYAAIMKILGFKVNRVGIYSLKDIAISWLPKKGNREKHTIEEYITESLKYLEKTVSEMRKGDFIATPLVEQTCRTCHERAYCPYIQSET